MEVGEAVQSAAVSDFILEIIVKHGAPARHYCNKDPFTMSHGTFLHETFPNAKMIFMIRDGRATAHSTKGTNHFVSSGKLLDPSWSVK